MFFGVREALYADSTLSIGRIVVEPADALSAARRKELDERFLGKNILRVNLEKIARELEANPEIRTARVTRRMPALLKIQIEARKPVALIRFSPRGPLGLISEDGVILDVLPQPAASLIIFEAFDAGIRQPKFGDRFRHPGFLEAVKFLKAFWGHPLARLETVTKITLDSFGNVTVTLRGDLQVRLGRRPAERFSAMEKVVPLLEREDRKQIEYVDLQFDSVIVKRKR